MSRDTVTADVEAEEAFALLGDETRIAILRALWEAQATPDGRRFHPRPMSFAALRERTGVRDSGRFNYHLNKLVGRFVRKTDEGYVLRLAGMQVVGAVLAGTYTGTGEVEPIPVDDPCPDCGGDLRVRYEDERATVDCVTCGETFASFGVQPGALTGYERAELPTVLDRWVAAAAERVRAGFCLNCAGRTRLTVRVPGDRPNDAPRADDAEAAADGERSYPYAEFVCQRCGDALVTSLPSALLTHPAVVAFHYDHGVDVREEPSWRLGWLHRSETTLLSTDPPRYSVRTTLDGEALRVVVDDELAAVEVVRSPAE